MVSIAALLSDGSTAAVTGGVVMGIFLVLLLIAAVVFYVFWYRKKHSKKTSANELRCVFKSRCAILQHWFCYSFFVFKRPMNNNSASHEQNEEKLDPDHEDKSDLKVSNFSPLV